MSTFGLRASSIKRKVGSQLIESPVCIGVSDGKAQECNSFHPDQINGFQYDYV
jgi:hypothetical protein